MAYILAGIIIARLTNIILKLANLEVEISVLLLPFAEEIFLLPF